MAASSPVLPGVGRKYSVPPDKAQVRKARASLQETGLVIRDSNPIRAIASSSAEFGECPELLLNAPKCSSTDALDADRSREIARVVLGFNCDA